MADQTMYHQGNQRVFAGGTLWTLLLPPANRNIVKNQGRERRSTSTSVQMVHTHTHLLLLSHSEIHHIQISLSFLCCRDLGQEPRPCRAVNRTLHAPYLTILAISQQPDKVKCRILNADILIWTYHISECLGCGWSTWLRRSLAISST